ncbi:hypothetical protein WN48_09582 [Eufriesea mexicana]|uniref:Uncharacterized protein n=1 Tax=Eufriesea mexicana TaxID=516756 RepID=A0A310SAK7_9HYME|nr:hypothetical protein WN48_09582 [Eufriesea mexicana]
MERKMAKSLIFPGFRGARSICMEVHNIRNARALISMQIKVANERAQTPHSHAILNTVAGTYLHRARGGGTYVYAGTNTDANLDRYARPPCSPRSLTTAVRS